MLILAVDDSRTTRRMIADTLAAEGHQVEQAANGSEAAALFASRNVDAVISDLTMEGGSGLDLLGAIRSGGRRQDVPFIVVTTEADPAIKAAAKQAGASAWVAKPFDPALIVTLIRRLKR